MRPDLLTGRRRALALGAAIGILLGTISHARAVPNVAAQVASYNPGGSASEGYRQPSSALGGLKAIADPLFGNSILSPFNPPYTPEDIVIVGDGGQLTLKLARPVAPQPGPEIGVFCNNGLIDVDFPNGQNADPAGFFSAPPQALVSVSSDGTNFVRLSSNPFTFEGVANFYADLGESPSFTTQHGTVPASMDKPFSGGLADFDGLNWTPTKALLDGSAGGAWLDIGPSGLRSVRYVRFEVPVGANYRMVVDAVAGAKPIAQQPVLPDRTGARPAVPEPAVIGVIAPAVLLVRRRRR